MSTRLEPLKHVTTEILDVAYYENVEGGHGAAADNEQLAFRRALALEFLWRHLGQRPAGQIAGIGQAASDVGVGRADAADDGGRTADERKQGRRCQKQDEAIAPWPRAVETSMDEGA